jgi:urease accessory protein
MTTATTATPDTATDATLLRLMWLASPALPVGGFSHSEGLEAAVEAGLVADEAQAREWLLGQLQLSLARNELPAVAEAFDAWAGHDATAAATVNDWLRQTRETAEQRAQAEQMGRALLEWLRGSDHAADARVAQLAALPGGVPLWGCAFALAAVLAGATRRQALLACAWSWAENMAQAAMKAVPLGQAAAQRILSAMAGAMPGAIDRALATPAGERQAFTPMWAVLSARHEAQYSRLFRS